MSSDHCLPTDSICSSQRVCTCDSGFTQSGTSCGKFPLQLVTTKMTVVHYNRNYTITEWRTMVEEQGVYLGRKIYGGGFKVVYLKWRTWGADLEWGIKVVRVRLNVMDTGGAKKGA